MTGHTFKSIREKYNLTQEQMAEALHYSKNGGNVRICKIEGLKRKKVSQYVINRFRLYANEMLPDGEFK
jgi:transcriptional regulator with XRE-family HTH domain